MDPLTLEPCTETNISLAAWFTKYDHDPDVQAKLQEVAGAISAEDEQRFSALSQHYVRYAYYKPVLETQSTNFFHSMTNETMTSLPLSPPESPRVSNGGATLQSPMKFAKRFSRLLKKREHIVGF